MCSQEEINSCANIAANFGEWDEEIKSADSGVISPIQSDVNNESEDSMENLDHEIPCAQGTPKELNHESDESMEYMENAQPFYTEETLKFDAEWDKKNQEWKKQQEEEKFKKQNRFPPSFPAYWLFDAPSYAFHPLITYQPDIPMPNNEIEYRKIGKGIVILINW